MPPVALVPVFGRSTEMNPIAAKSRTADSDLRYRWLRGYRAVRSETEKRAVPLSAEDQVVQSMPDASPTKWHRAHTTWFFEQFLLLQHDAYYRRFDERFGYLYNSYYVTVGPRHARPQRGLLTRPDMSEVAAYRAHVDAAVAQLIEHGSAAMVQNIVPVVEMGLHHEQQHQELMLTDILHAFAQNPTHPAYDDTWRMPHSQPNSEGLAAIASGIHSIGHDDEGFFFDNEGPQHGSHSSTPAVMRRRPSGCRTAGPPWNPKDGKRRAIGRRSTASGSP